MEIKVIKKSGKYCKYIQMEFFFNYLVLNFQTYLFYLITEFIYLFPFFNNFFLINGLMSSVLNTFTVFEVLLIC